MSFLDFLDKHFATTVGFAGTLLGALIAGLFAWLSDRNNTRRLQLQLAHASQEALIARNLEAPRPVFMDLSDSYVAFIESPTRAINEEEPATVLSAALGSFGGGHAL
jgi:hypothetical protein